KLRASAWIGVHREGLAGAWPTPYWIGSEMMIVPGEAGSDARSDPTPKHRPTGLGARWAPRSWRKFWLPRSNLTSPCSRAVRALSGVSALCPFLHERRDHPLMALAAIKYSDASH